jgi:hypothetical protein
MTKCHPPLFNPQNKTWGQYYFNKPYSLRAARNAAFLSSSRGVIGRRSSSEAIPSKEQKMEDRGQRTEGENIRESGNQGANVSGTGNQET